MKKLIKSEVESVGETSSSVDLVDLNRDTGLQLLPIFGSNGCVDCKEFGTNNQICNRYELFGSRSSFSSLGISTLLFESQMRRNQNQENPLQPLENQQPQQRCGAVKLLTDQVNHLREDLNYTRHLYDQLLAENRETTRVNREAMQDLRAALERTTEELRVARQQNLALQNLLGQRNVNAGNNMVNGNGGVQENNNLPGHHVGGNHQNFLNPDQVEHFFNEHQAGPFMHNQAGYNVNNNGFRHQEGWKSKGTLIVKNPSNVKDEDV